MRLFRFDSPLMQFLTRVYDLMIVNLLFLLCALPIFTLGAAITAMYRVLIDLHNESENGIIISFFRAFRDNFKHATSIFLILLFPTLLITYELWIYFSGAVENNVVVAIIFILPSILLLFIVSYVYPLTAQFENSPLKTIKNACLFSIIHLPTTILIATINLLPVVLLLFFTDFFLRICILVLMLGFSLIAYADTILLLRVFKKYMTQNICENSMHAGNS